MLSIRIADIVRMPTATQEEIARMFFEAGFNLRQPIEKTFDKESESLVFVQPPGSATLQRNISKLAREIVRMQGSSAQPMGDKR